MADPSLDPQVQHVEHAHRGALGACTRRGRHGDQRVQWTGRGAPGADRRVEVFGEVAVVGGEQVDGLGGVDAGAAADRDERVPGAGLVRVVDGGTERDVGRLDAYTVEH